MKYRRNKFCLMYIILGILVMNLILSSINSPKMLNTISALNYVVDVKIPHPPIRITSDEELSQWGGSGTEADPYRIYNLNITDDDDCIYITNTTKHFVINKCLIQSETDTSGNGIVLENVKNGVIYSTVAKRKLNGILLRNCSHIQLTYDTMIKNDENGVIIQNSVDVYIEEIYLSMNNGFGMKIATTIFGTILNSYLKGNNRSLQIEDSVSLNITDNDFGSDGIKLIGYDYQSWNHVIQDNMIQSLPLGYFKGCNGDSINGSQYGQIILFDCESLIIRGGHFSEIQTAIQIAYSTNCTIQNVTADHTLNYGISLINSSDSKISQCRFDYNKLGVLIRNCNETFLNLNSIMKNNEYGVMMIKSKRIIFEENQVISNLENGVSVLGTQDLIMSNNSIQQNEKRGVHFQDTINGSIVNNNISLNGDGIYLVQSNNCSISGNTISENRNDGIYLTESTCCIIKNNLIKQNDGIGVFLDVNTTKNVIFSNSFVHNHQTNSYDDGFDNSWNSSEVGNYWSDFEENAPYSIPGNAGSFDYHPIVENPNKPQSEILIPISILMLFGIFLGIITVLWYRQLFSNEHQIRNSRKETEKSRFD